MDKFKSKVKSTKALPIAKGGKAMFGRTQAAKAETGKTSVGGRKGNDSFSPDKGGKKMAGFTGSTPSKVK